MKSKGGSTTADIFVLSLLVVFACLLLIVSSPFQDRGKLDARAEITAQNIFLVFHQVPVEEFGNLSYVPNLPLERPTERVLRKKTVVQLIAECVLLNPEYKVKDVFLKDKTNSEYEKKLLNFLDNLLERAVGDRFGFQFVVQLDSIELSEDKVLRYRKSIGDFDGNSRRLCSESTSLVLVFPPIYPPPRPDPHFKSFILDRGFVPGLNPPLKENWIGGRRSSLGTSSVEFGTLRLTLELWSR
ncbi:hypothetical protein AKJ64_03070 [candidate division MSBL1 archaeon SCGC-AAA259E17]|uniref:Uncharacterized protein n=1 Tax=candidate division MSBL1 archaeon SCGC-AAA259E17 TaxID=1698263 RepID=A0A133UE62_9EURY|nr:hypothetical protein AKJ64_03070 [candidate division MSBL1 archaeon SCGC-AAA259E17]